MGQYRERHSGRGNERGQEPGHRFEDRYAQHGYERYGGRHEQYRGQREQEREGYYQGPDDHGFSRRGHGYNERGGSEAFGSQERFGAHEPGYRDFGRGQHESGGYDPYEDRGYRYGEGYGGYGASPGEAGGGFGSGRSYSAEPGWGPGYGDRGRQPQSAYGHERGYPGSQRSPSGFDHPSAAAREYRGGGYYGQGGFGERTREGFGQSEYGYGGEAWREGAQRRQIRGPKGYQRSDERLKEDISERLMAMGHRIDASEVTVEVQDGKVTLEGTVPERRMKHAIEDLVDDCMGVKDIDNRVRVVHGQPGGMGGMQSAQTSIGTGYGGGGSSGSSSSGSSSTFGDSGSK
jgi:hypothetical protein